MARDRRWGMPGSIGADMHEVIRGAAMAFVLKLAGAGLTFVFNVALARFVGAEGVGVYFLALTIQTIATVFGRLGLENTLLRMTAASAAVTDWAALRGLYRRGLGVAAVASVATATVVVLLGPLLSSRVFHQPSLLGPLYVMAIGVIPTVLFTLQGEMLRGLRRIAESSLIQFCALPALSLGLIVLPATFPRTIMGAAWATLAAAVATALLATVLWARAMPQAALPEVPVSTRTLLDSSLPLLWVKSLNMAMGWVSTIALGLWATTADVGVFNAASRTALLGGLVLMAINSIAAPKFAALHRTGDMAALGRVARDSTRLMVVVSLPVLLIFLLAPGAVMRIFGEEFRGGAAALAILAVGQCVNVMTGSVGNLLMMTGNERLMQRSVNIAVIVNVVLNVVLVPLFGVIGAAIATAVSLISLNVVAARFVHAHLGIVTLPFLATPRQASSP